MKTVLPRFRAIALPLFLVLVLAPFSEATVYLGERPGDAVLSPGQSLPVFLLPCECGKRKVELYVWVESGFRLYQLTPDRQWVAKSNRSKLTPTFTGKIFPYYGADIQLPEKGDSFRLHVCLDPTADGMLDTEHLDCAYKRITITR